MDIIDALRKWESLGGTFVNHDDEQGHYTIDFLNKDNQVVGWFKVYAGQGFRWSYPDELFSA